jgi:hypothetical protein
MINKFKSKPIQWKIAFLNSNINGHPQNNKIKKENVERFILQLKTDDLFAEFEDEIDEFLEFEKFDVVSAASLKEICYASSSLRIIGDNYIPIKFLLNNLVANKVEKIILLEKANSLEDFCVNSKLKQEIWYNLVNCELLVSCRIIINWKPIKRAFVKMNCFESPTQKLKRMFEITLQEKRRKEIVEKNNSKIKYKNKIKNEEFIMLAEMVNSKFKK